MPKRDSQSHCLGVEKLKNSARTFLGITLSVKTGTHQRTHLPRTWGVVALETETKTLTLAHPRVHDHPRNFFRERPRPKSKSVTATVFQRNQFLAHVLKISAVTQIFSKLKIRGKRRQIEHPRPLLFCGSQIWTAGAKFHGTLARASRLAPGPLHFSL